MAEFRTALREEIESASRNESSGAVPLVNGRRIAQVGGAFQYIFDIESALNLPGDAPGDLYLPGCPPVAVSVVSVDGMAITLSVPQDIGVFVPQGRLQSNLTFLMRKLIERIENRAAAENQVGDRIMGVLPVSGEPVEPSQDPFPLNEHQRAAVASSLGRNTTFIWGPPGTGKSRTIGAIAWHLYQQGRSVLLVSHTNIAVDGALSHIADALDRAVLQQGHVLRIGEPKDPKISSNPELLLRTHVDRRSEELALRREALIAERINLADKVGQLCRSIDIYEWALQAQGDIATMTREVQTLQSLEAELRDASAEEARLAAMKSHWATAASKAREACRDVEELANLENQLAQIGRQRETAEGEAREADQRLSEAERILVTAVAIAPLRSRMRMLPSNNEQVRNVEESRLREKKARDLHRDCSGRLSQAVKLLVEARACGALMRLWRGLPAPEEQQKLVDALKARTESAAKQAEETEKELLAAVQMLTEVTDLTSRLAPHRGVPDADVQKRAVDEQRRQVATCAAKLEKLARAADEAAGVRQRCIAAIQSFYDQYTDKPDNVMQKANAHAAQLDSARSRSAQLACECSRRRLDSEQILSSRLAVLREWNLTSDSAGTA